MANTCDQHTGGKSGIQPGYIIWKKKIHNPIFTQKSLPLLIPEGITIPCCPLSHEIATRRLQTAKTAHWFCGQGTQWFRHTYVSLPSHKNEISEFRKTQHCFYSLNNAYCLQMLLSTFKCFSHCLKGSLSLKHQIPRSFLVLNTRLPQYMVSLMQACAHTPKHIIS